MHSVIIIDDAVDKETQDMIENSIFCPETQWTLGRTVFYHTHPEVTEQARKTGMGFTKSLYRVDDNFSDNQLDLYLSPLINNAYVSELYTVRLQLQLPTNTGPHGTPHIDGDRGFPFMVAVYYVNDSDGDTVLFKQTTANTTPEEVKSGRLDIEQTISPKKGRLIIFDGNIYHATGKPNKDLRCIINYNFS